MYTFLIMKITIKRIAEKQIGNLRVSARVFEKVFALSKKRKVSKQTIIRAILEQVIDKVEL